MILASKSPRRKEILENIGFNLVIKSEDIEEVSDKVEVVEKIKDIAYKKVEAVAKKYPNEPTGPASAARSLRCVCAHPSCVPPFSLVFPPLRARPIPMPRLRLL